MFYGRTSLLRSRFLGGALREVPKHGCEGDYLDGRRVAIKIAHKTGEWDRASIFPTVLCVLTM